MKKLPWLLWQLVTRNRKACAALRKLEGIQLGFVLILLRWIPTWGITLAAWMLRRQPFVRPYLPIAAEEYYFYQVFFVIPFGILLWILSAGVAQTCSIALRGQAHFKDTLNYFAMVSLLLAPIVWIADGVAVALDLWVPGIVIPIHAGVALLKVVLYAAGMRNLHGFPIPIAALIGIFSMAAYYPIAVLVMR